MCAMRSAHPDSKAQRERLCCVSDSAASDIPWINSASSSSKAEKPTTVPSSCRNPEKGKSAPWFSQIMSSFGFSTTEHRYTPSS